MVNKQPIRKVVAVANQEDSGQPANQE
jgi:hypothetical protein